jgi:signal transduction histidine kinase
LSRLRSLRWRLALLYVGVAAAMLAVVLTVVTTAVEAALIRTTAQRLEVEAGLVAAEGGPGNKGPRATDLAAGDLAAILGGTGTAVVILDANGAPLAAQANGAPPEVQVARLDPADYSTVIATGTTVNGIRPGLNGGRVLLVAAPVQLRTTGPGGGNGKGNGNGNGRGLGNQQPGQTPEIATGPANAIAQLGVSLNPVDATLADLRRTTAIVGVVVLAVGAGALALVTRAGLLPLDRIAHAADRIAGGDLAARASLPTGSDEVGRLARAFDGMADRVDATLQAQRQFAADASHELRSPLTVLGGYVDVLGRQELDPETRSRTLGAMRKEIDRLSRLSNDLLLLTQLEAGGGRSNARLVDLGELIEDIGAAARAIGPDRRIEVVGDGALPVWADPDRLTQALMNLVDNAVRHSPSGGLVRIAARGVDGRAVAEITNEGEAIAPEDLAHVFDRFYRGSNGSASRQEGHAGLGLAIVKAIVQSSGGDVSATCNEGTTRFSIGLPLKT